MRTKDPRTKPYSSDSIFFKNKTKRSADARELAASLTNVLSEDMRLQALEGIREEVGLKDVLAHNNGLMLSFFPTLPYLARNLS